MKLLAIVENSLRSVLERNLGCEVEFYASWQSVDPADLPGFGCVVASGMLIESPEDPLVLWGVASAIRYFGVPAIFVDTSFDAGSLIPRVYPQIKLISYQGDADQFLLQLRTYAPQLFFDNPRFSSSFSASANAWRYQENSKSSELNISLDGVRQSGIMNQPVQQSAAMTGSFGAISSIPLGMQRSVSSRISPAPAPSASSATFRKEGMGPGRMDDSDEFDFNLSEISSSSSISGLDGISDILEAADAESEEIKASLVDNPNPANRPRAQIANATNALQSRASVSVARAVKDVQAGKIEFGSLIRVAVTVMRLKLTGVMEIQSDMRSVRLEFRRGEPFATCSSQAILSALCWSTGDFIFNPSRLLSINSQKVDLWQLIQSAVMEQFPLQPLCRVLEGNYPHYIAYSDHFDQSRHRLLNASSGLLDGQHTILECLNYYQQQEEIARDLYMAYLCDDVCLFDRAVQAPVIIQYEVVDASAQSSLHAASSQLSDAAQDNSQINAVRTDLLRVRASFDTDDGYKILGLQAGCGVTALDDAYYAWINRYHSDRFVRYNDPSFVKLANELLMLMNSTYSRLAKAERANSCSRIGVGRARLSTINVQRNNQSSSALLNSSSSLSASSSSALASDQKVIRRPSISGTSVHSMNAVAADAGQQKAVRPTPKPGAQVMTMSEILAKRSNSGVIAQESSVEHAVPEPQVVRSPSVVLRAPSSVRKSSSASMPANNATAQQHFSTAKKKLALGLARDALTAMDWALQAEPDNAEYKAYRAYAAFLADATVRDNSLEIVQKSLEQMRANAEIPKESLFEPYYFIGKMQMAAENYQAAKEALTRASRINPNDVDTQRSIRYVEMQLGKQKEAPQNKGLFSSLKEKLSKKL